MIRGRMGVLGCEMIRGRRGEELGGFAKIAPFLFLLFVIGGGIVAGVYLFFGGEYEFREIDAEILSYKVKKCILEKEIDWGAGDFYELCRIDARVLEGSSFILKVCRNSEDCASGEGLISVGGNFQACRFEGVKENDAYPRCVEKTFVKAGERYEIISGGNQRIRRGI